MVPIVKQLMKKPNYYFFRFSETCSNYVTNPEGLLSFSVPLNSESIPQNISKLLFRAIALDFPANETSKMQQPSNKLHVALTKSNLTSALAIQSARQPTVECGENSIATYYTAKPGEALFVTFVIKLNSLTVFFFFLVDMVLKNNVAN